MIYKITKCQSASSYFTYWLQAFPAPLYFSKELSGSFFHTIQVSSAPLYLSREGSGYLSLKQFKYFPPLSTCPERGLDWISHLNSSSISRPSLLVQRGVWSSLLYNSSIYRPSLLVQRGVWISLLYSSSSILLQRGVGAWEFTKRIYNQKVCKCTETH